MRDRMRWQAYSLAVCLLATGWAGAAGATDWLQWREGATWQHTLYLSLDATLAAAESARGDAVAAYTLGAWQRHGPTAVAADTLRTAALAPEAAPGADPTGPGWEPAEALAPGKVTLLRLPTDTVTYYACTLNVTTPGNVFLTIRTNEPSVVWLDGERVASGASDDPRRLDPLPVRRRLEKGAHRLLLRLACSSSAPAIAVDTTTDARDAQPPLNRVLAQKVIDAVLAHYADAPNPIRHEIAQERLLGMWVILENFRVDRVAERYESRVDMLRPWVPADDAALQRDLKAIPALAKAAQTSGEIADLEPVWTAFHRLNTAAQKAYERQLRKAAGERRYGQIRLHGPEGAEAKLQLLDHGLYLGAGIPSYWITEGRDYLDPGLSPAPTAKLSVIKAILEPPEFNALRIAPALRFDQTQRSPGQIVADVALLARRWHPDPNFTVRLDALCGDADEEAPAWLAALAPDQQRVALEARVRYLLPLVARPGQTVDLFGLSHNGKDVATAVNAATVASLYTLARQLAPDSPLGLSLEGSLQSDRVLDVHLAYIADLQKRGAVIDELAVTLNLRDSVEYYAIYSRLDALAKRVPRITITDLNIRSESPDWQDDMLIEIYLLLWSHPAIVGIYEGRPFLDGRNVDRSYALFSQNVQPNAAGNQRRGLITRTWCPSMDVTIDATGSRLLKVPYGWYRIDNSGRSSYRLLTPEAPTLTVELP